MNILEGIFKRNGHTPSDEAHMGAEEVHSANGGNGDAVGGEAPAPAGGNHTTNGWNFPPLTPPDPHDVSGELSNLLGELQKILDYKQRSWHLSWVFQTQVAVATAERDRLRLEAKNRLDQLNAERAKQRDVLTEQITTEEQRLDKLEEELDEAKAAFAAATAEAQLVCDENPDTLKAALDGQRPNHIQVAGEAGVQPLTPVPDPKKWDWSHSVGIAVGLILGLCLATVIGMFHLSDLHQPDGLFRLVVACGIGCAIVWMLGEFVAYVVTVFARWLEPPREEEVPAFRHPLHVAWAFGIAAVVLLVAEVCVEAYGIYTLQAQLNALSSDWHPLHPIVYALLGTLATGTFVAFKVGRCWTYADRELRRCWMHHRQRRWGQDTCSAEAVQEAFRQCHRIARIKDRTSETRQRIRAFVGELEMLEPLTECDEPLRETLRKAEIAALATTDQFHEFVRKLLEDAGQPIPPAPKRVGSPDMP